MVHFWVLREKGVCSGKKTHGVEQPGWYSSLGKKKKSPYQPGGEGGGGKEKEGGTKVFLTFGIQKKSCRRKDSPYGVCLGNHDTIPDRREEKLCRGKKGGRKTARFCSEYCIYKEGGRRLSWRQGDFNSAGAGEDRCFVQRGKKEGRKRVHRARRIVKSEGKQRASESRKVRFRDRSFVFMGEFFRGGGGR